MSMSTFINNSRTAPRDPQDVRRKQAKILFHDKKQYKLAEERSEDEMPPHKEGALASSSSDYRVKAIHRSFASPSTARANARAQVDDIILRSSEEQVAMEVGERETERIQRLREQNRKRLSALEKKLQQLQQQKRDLEDSSEDEVRDESSPPRRGPAAASSVQESPPSQQARSAWADAKAGRPPSVPSGRAKIHTKVPAGLPKPERDSDSSPAFNRQSEPESEDGRDKGYTSDPGQERERTQHPLQSGRSSLALGKRRKPRRRPLSAQPFSFDGRVPIMSMRQRKFEEEMQERRELEESEYNTRIPARNPPKTSLMRDLYQKSVLQQQQRSEENRAKSKQRLSEQEAPFTFWKEAREREAKKMAELERDTEHLRERLLLLADNAKSARARIARVERDAWSSVQTDFTSVEEEELERLARKFRMDRKLRPREEERYRELQRQSADKHSSKEYIVERHRRLKAELEKQENRFRCTPVPAAVTDDVSAQLAEEARVRKLRRDERKSLLQEQSQWPDNMVRQGHAEKLEQRQKEMEKKLRLCEEDRRRLRPTKLRDTIDGDTVTEEHTFKPKIQGGVPDFQSEHTRFRAELQKKKLEMQKDSRQTKLKPFYLRSEWIPMSKFLEHRAVYQAAAVSSKLRRKKLEDQALSAQSSQWDLIEKLAASNHKDLTKSGLTQEQVWEFYVTPPSQHAISAQITLDIQVLKDSRWPHARGGRCEAKPKPIATGKAQKWKETEAYMKRLKHIHDTQKQREEEEAERKRKADADRQKRREMWGMRDRVLSKLAQDAAERHAKKEEQKKQVIQARREFKEQDKEWEDKVMSKVENLKAKSLLMEDITTRLKKQAKDQFRKHLKAHGLEDLADEIELPR